MADSAFALLSQPEAEASDESEDDAEAQDGPHPRRPLTRRRSKAEAPPAANTRNVATRRPAAHEGACVIA